MKLKLCESVTVNPKLTKINQNLLKYNQNYETQ